MPRARLLVQPVWFPEDLVRDIVKLAKQLKDLRDTISEKSKQLTKEMVRIKNSQKKVYSEDKVVRMVKRACGDHAAKCDFGSGRYIPKHIKDALEKIVTETDFSSQKIIFWVEEELDKTAK